MVAATTGPGATCMVAVRYPSGHGATSAALATSQTADAGGRVAWTWRLSARRLGTALATVHCVQGAREGSGTAAFAIQERRSARSVRCQTAVVRQAAVG